MPRSKCMAWKRWDQPKTTLRGSLWQWTPSSWPTAPSDRSLYWNLEWYQWWTSRRSRCPDRIESPWLEAQRRCASAGRSPSRWSGWTSWYPRWPWWRHLDTKRTCFCFWWNSSSSRPLSPAPPQSRTCCLLQRCLTICLLHLMSLLLLWRASLWYSGSCCGLTACWSLRDCLNYVGGFTWISQSCQTFLLFLLLLWCQALAHRRTSPISFCSAAAYLIAPSRSWALPDGQAYVW